MRPRIKISNEDIKEVERLAGLGLNREQIANSLGFSYDTLKRRSKDMPVLLEAIKRGKAKAIETVSNKLMEQIEQGNLTAIIFYLKTQGGFTETNRQIITDKDPNENNVEGGLADLYKRMQNAWK